MAAKRPPKSWWRRCVRKVREAARGMVIDGESVCGALWSRKMSPAAKRRAKAKAYSAPRRKQR